MSKCETEAVVKLAAVHGVVSGKFGLRAGGLVAQKAFSLNSVEPGGCGMHM